MKKIFFTYAIISMCAITMNDVYSQIDNNFLQQNTKWQITVNSPRDYRNAINIKVVRRFLREFKDVKNVTWSKTNFNGYAAQFVNDSILTTIGYYKDGALKYLFKEYDVKMMEENIRGIVKNVFPDFTIIAVKEINLEQEYDVIYSVVIKNGNNFKLLKIVNNKIEVASEFTKG